MNIGIGIVSPAKASPTTGDLVLLCDAADSYKSKKLTLANLLNVVYPVGSVYTNASNSTNPGTLLGIGTWVAIEGQCVVGLKAADADFGAVGAVAAGEKTHTLTEAELAAHAHILTGGVSAEGGAGGSLVSLASVLSNKTYTTSSTGSGTAHNNIQPSYVCYVWRRTV